MLKSEVMKRITLILLLVAGVQFAGCTKEDVEQTTTFEGVVRLTGSSPSFDGLKILVTGYTDCGIFCTNSVTRGFAVNPDGSFSFQITTSEERDFDIGLGYSKLEYLSSQCSPRCSDLSAGKEHSDLVLYASLP